MGDAYAWVHSNSQNDTTYTTKGEGCKLHSFDTELDITITLPRWTNVEQRSEKHQKWWKQLIAFITAHELKHKRIIIDAAEDFQQAAKTIGVQANCYEVKDRYRKLKYKYASQIRARDYKLDFKDRGRMRIKDFLFINALPSALKLKMKTKLRSKISPGPICLSMLGTGMTENVSIAALLMQFSHSRQSAPALLYHLLPCRSK
jgi:hypothetical protein